MVRAVLPISFGSMLLDKRFDAVLENVSGRAKPRGSRFSRIS
jgi:hypothetical protein